MKNYLLLGGGFLVLIVVCVATIHYEAEQTRKAVREGASSGIRDGIRGSVADSTDAVKVGDLIGKIQATLDADEPADGQPAKDPFGKLTKPAAKTAGDVLDTLHELMKPAGRSTEKTNPDESQAADHEPVESKASAAGKVAEKVQSTLGELVGKVPVPGAPQKSDAKTTPAEQDAQGDDVPRRGNGPADLIADFFEFTKQSTKATDAIGQGYLKLSVEEERAWGKKLHEQIILRAKVVRDPQVTKRVARLAKPLVAACRREGIDYTFTVIESEKDDINSFAILGGYIYVHSGLIDFVKDDHELQFVLGHEVAHVDLEHCTRQLTYSARASGLNIPLAGELVGVLNSLLTRSYTKDQEFEADEYAYRGVIAAGQTKDQALSFPRRFGMWLTEHDHEHVDEKSPNVLSTLARHARDHFHTHPPMHERIARLEAIKIQQPSAAK